LPDLAQWHAGLLAPYGGLDQLRAAEKSAKEKRLGLWEGYGASATKGTVTNGHTNGSSTTKGTSFEGTVVRVRGSDQISVVEKGDEYGKERRLQFASVRGPRYADSSPIHSPIDDLDWSQWNGTEASLLGQRGEGVGGPSDI